MIKVGLMQRTWCSVLPDSMMQRMEEQKEKRKKKKREKNKEEMSVIVPSETITQIRQATNYTHWNRYWSLKY